LAFSYHESGGTTYKVTDAKITVRCGLHNNDWVMYDYELSDYVLF